MENSLKCQALILKVASKCNLNCTYCYMYNLGDITYLQQPKFMSEEVVEATLQRVQTHCLKHNLKHFEFIFHGGEPLLLSKDFYKRFVEKAKKLLLPQTQPMFSMQTNGILLTEEWCQLLGELNISLGISLDGTAAINNKFRIDHGGKGSYAAIVKGLKVAQRSPYLDYPPSILCVIDVTADPLEVYRHLIQLSVKRINFLLPYSTYDNPPPNLIVGTMHTPYADWLIPIFDEWFDGRGPKPKIRLFEQIIELIVGIDRGFEYLGGRNLEFLVVETNGSIEVAGALKVCGNGFTKAGIHVLEHELDEALHTDLARLYHLSHQLLPQQCKLCPVVKICGGGFLPHRYRRENGFSNPSIFCLDLMKLISHIQNKLWEFLSDSTKLNVEFEPISFEEMKNSIKLRNTKEKSIYEQ